MRSCQRVDVEEDKEPQPVIRVSPETLKELIQKTTIPRNLPEEVPSCRDSDVVEATIIDEEPRDVVGQTLIDEEPPDVVRCPCPPGQELVGGACEGCPRWKKYSRRTCSCVSRCRHDKQCRRCETCRNGFCEPIHKKCPPGQKWDKKTCACVGECRPIHCQEGFWFNPKTCRCERKQPCNKKCPQGQTLDEKTCTCVGCRPIDCQEGFWFNPKTCRCERKQPCDKKCPQGQHLDLAACKCVRDGTVPTKGCTSDSECGPRSVCRHGKCVPKEGHLEKPSRHEREQPVERVHPSKQEREQPAERMQPYQRKDQRQ